MFRTIRLDQALEASPENHRPAIVTISGHRTFGQTLVIDGELRVGDPSAFLHEGRLLLEEVRAAGSRPVLLVPPLGPDAPPLDQQAVDWAYTRLGRESGARLAPVSDAFARVRRRRPEVALFDAHGKEWSTAGAYLASAVLEATVTGRHPGASSGPIRIEAAAEGAAEAAADKTEIEPGAARGRLSAELLQLLDREAWAAVRDLAADGGYRDIRPPAFPPVPTLPHGSVVPAATLEGTWTGPLRLYPWPATLELRVTAVSGTPRVTGHVRFEDGRRDLTFDGSDVTYKDGVLSFRNPADLAEGRTLYQLVFRRPRLSGVAELVTDDGGAYAIGSFELTPLTPARH